MLKRSLNWALDKLVLDPCPHRRAALWLIKKLRLGNYKFRVKIGAVDRPHYGHCVYNAAFLARKLGYPRLSVLEFGVAGGAGLLNLEYHARNAAAHFSVGIDVYGFDTAAGLPEPLDYRDLPYFWREGSYSMDVQALKARLQNAQLVLGDVRETAKNFFRTYNPAPVGAVMYDLDFYSSTSAALKMLEGGEQYHLPRVFCYFDNITGTELQLYSDYTGERLAIREFNETHDEIKLAPAYYLLGRSTVPGWHHRIWICHFLGHRRYCDFIGPTRQELPCT